MRLSALPHPQPGEDIVLVLRRHWFAALGIIAMFVVLAIIPPILYVFLQNIAPSYFDHPVIAPALGILGVIYYLGIWLFSFTDFVDYYLDVWIVTTGRIINVEQMGLFRRTESELNLSSIQDVTSEIRGPIQTLFGFGQVHVQTAAERTRFHLKNIPHPERVQETIMHLAEGDRLKEGVSNTGAVQSQ